MTGRQYPPQPAATRELARLVRTAACATKGGPEDFDPLLELVGDARVVLLGEASHGTHEFYRVRAAITKRLILERGFTAVAVEADWPDAYRVNRFVRGVGSDTDATEALDGFHRFPQWMWRNADVLDFVGWLRAANEARPADTRVGFYGLDLYSLHASMAAVVAYLQVADPPAARRAAARYACFDHFDGDTETYGMATTLGLAPSCEAGVVRQLVELRANAAEYALRDGRLAPDDLFYAEQNARVVRNAEAYYRAMIGGAALSWNLRDRHMMGTLEALVDFLGATAGRRSPPRVVVWAHNSHLGDARATAMGARGELNVGQLVRERWGTDAVAVGFTTYSGTVTAAADWGGRAERMTVRDALPDSMEALFHLAGPPSFLLRLRPEAGPAGTAGVGSATDEVASALAGPMLQRAIGVVYRPYTERRSHYFSASLARQFDAVLHYDRTRAVEPLERTPTWERGELPETYPTAL